MIYLLVMTDIFGEDSYSVWYHEKDAKSERDAIIGEYISGEIYKMDIN